MNKFTKRLITLVIFFIILIPVAFFVKAKIDEDSQETTEKVGEKNEDTKGEDAEAEEAKKPENPKEEDKKPDSEKPQDPSSSKPDDKKSDLEQTEEEIKTLESDIKAREEKLKDLKDKLASLKGDKPVKSFVEAYDAKEIRDNMENYNYQGKKLAFLTFDDGVNTQTSIKILQVLKDNEINATFFIPGINLENEENQKVLKKLYEDGNAIATHSYNHDYELLYPGRQADSNQIVKEHKETVDLMKSILGDDFDTKLFRYPGGHMSWDWDSIQVSDKALSDMGVTWIDWNSMTGDAQPIDAGPNDISRPQSVDQVISNFEQSLGYIANPNQVVILMHDALDKDLTPESLQALINHLKNEGYEFGIMK